MLSCACWYIYIFIAKSISLHVRCALTAEGSQIFAVMFFFSLMPYQCSLFIFFPSHAAHTSSQCERMRMGKQYTIFFVLAVLLFIFLMLLCVGFA